MNEQLLIYLWAILPNIIHALICMMIILGAIGIAGNVFYYTYCEIDPRGYTSPFTSTKDRDTFRKYMDRCLIIFIVCLFFRIFIPSRNEVALVFAYPYIKQGVTNERVIGIPSKILDIANIYLQKVIEDAKNDTSN